MQISHSHVCTGVGDVDHVWTHMSLITLPQFSVCLHRDIDRETFRSSITAPRVLRCLCPIPAAYSLTIYQTIHL